MGHLCVLFALLEEDFYSAIDEFSTVLRLDRGLELVKEGVAPSVKGPLIGLDLFTGPADLPQGKLEPAVLSRLAVGLAPHAVVIKGDLIPGDADHVLAAAHLDRVPGPEESANAKSTGHFLQREDGHSLGAHAVHGLGRGLDGFLVGSAPALDGARVGDPATSDFLDREGDGAEFAADLVGELSQPCGEQAAPRAVGGAPALDDRPQDHVRAVFDLAAEFGLPVDMHVDESDRREDFTLPFVIEAAR